MSDERIMGGRRALAGFYYQLLGTLGAVTLQTRFLNESPSTEGNPSAILSLAKFTTDHVCQFRPEEAGQDLTIDAGDHQLLIQYKFSMDPDSHEVGLDDVREILIGFAHSLATLRTSGVSTDAITGCVLITNRPSGRALDQVKNWVTASRLAINIKTSDIQPLLSDAESLRNTGIEFHLQGVTSYQGSLEGIMDRWVKEAKPPIDKKTGEAAPIKLAQVGPLVEDAILTIPRLYVITDLHPEFFQHQFQKFGREHGADDENITRAQRELIGLMMEPSQQFYALSVAELKRILTGSSQANRLTVEGIGPACASSWREWVSEQKARQPWTIRRDRSDFDRALNGECRVIVIIGQGGCGKTEFLAQITEPQIQALENHTGFEGFVSLAWAPAVSGRWVSQAVATWSGHSVAMEDERFDRLMERVRRANPAHSGSVLFLTGLDGLDEKEKPSSFGEVFDAVRRYPDLRLVLTCRESDLKEIDSEIFTQNATGSLHASSIKSYTSVRIGVFQGDELLDLLHKGCILSVCSSLTSKTSPAAPSSG